MEIRQLKDCCVMMLKPVSNPSVALVNETVSEVIDELHLDHNESASEVIDELHLVNKPCRAIMHSCPRLPQQEVYLWSLCVNVCFHFLEGEKYP